MKQENTLTTSFHKYGKSCQAHERTRSFQIPPSSFSKGCGTQGASMPSTIILLNPQSLGTHAVIRDADEQNTAFQLSQLKKSSVPYLSLVSRMPQIHPVSNDDLLPMEYLSKVCDLIPVFGAATPHQHINMVQVFSSLYLES